MKTLHKRYKTYLIAFLLSLMISLVLNYAVIAAPTIQIPIFSLHEIIDVNKTSVSEGSSQERSSGTEYTNTKQDLEKFLEYLARNRYWVLSSQELYDYFLAKSKLLPLKYLLKKPIMLTFDDGYKGVHTHLLPVLEALKAKYRTTIKLVWFVNPVSLGVPESNNFFAHVSCEELRTGVEKGYYDIQSHGFSHAALTQLDSESLMFELAEAQTALRKCAEGLDSAQKVASQIAYPYGMSNARVESYTSKYYLAGYSYENKVLQVDQFKNMYQIPRLNIKKDTSLTKMIQLAESSSRLFRRSR